MSQPHYVLHSHLSACGTSWIENTDTEKKDVKLSESVIYGFGDRWKTHILEGQNEK